jgi:alanine racemase
VTVRPSTIAIDQSEASTVTVDCAAIRHNTSIIRRTLGSTQLLAVIKAQAYGHGAVPVAEAVLAGGADALCTSSLSEAFEVADIAAQKPCIVLGNVSSEELSRGLPRNIELTAHSLEQVERFGALNLPFHMNLNTGLNRGGLSRLPVSAPRSCVGVMTQLAHGHVDSQRALGEFERFFAVTRHLEGVLLRHAASSGPFLTAEKTWLDAVRIGQLILGLKPRSAGYTALGVVPALTWTTHLVQVEPISVGQPVGYGARYVADQDGWIGVLPIGYADGLHPSLQGSSVRVANTLNRLCAVSMDSAVVLLNEPVPVGAEVTLVGEGISIDDHARAVDVNNVEISVFASAATSRGRRLFRRQTRKCESMTIDPRRAETESEPEREIPSLRDLDVVVACGGHGAERDGSLVSASTVAEMLHDRVRSVEVVDIAAPDFFQRATSCATVFNASHGLHGEDGALQGALDMLGVSYTGSRGLTNTICMDKEIFKQLLVANRLPTAPWRSVPADAGVGSLHVALQELEGPWFVKPVVGGESFASGPAHSITEVQRIIAGAANAEFERFIIEPLVNSPNYTVAVWRDDEGFVDLPVLETRTARVFYDSVAKQDPSQRTHHCPARLAKEDATEMVRTARRVYELVRAESLVRVDFMIDDNGPIVLEANTVPGFSLQGNLATILQRSGHHLEGFVIEELRRASGRRNHGRPLPRTALPASSTS